MRSVADLLRAQTALELADRTAAERVALALALGRRDLEAFRLAHGLSVEEARRELARRRQLGRRRSRSAEDAGGG